MAATKTQTVLGVLEGGLEKLAETLLPSSADPIIAAAGTALKALIAMQSGTLPPLDAKAIVEGALGAFGADDTEVDADAKAALDPPAVK